MFASLRALLSGVIDYAGLFPPAQLSLDQSIRNYARYRREPENWMLGRFICPAVRLAELVPYLDELFQDGARLTCSALGRGATDGVEFKSALRKDLEYIAAFRQEAAGRAVVDVIEAKGAEVFNSWWALAVYRHTGDLQIEPLTPYAETHIEHDWRTSIGSVITSVAALRVMFSRDHGGPATCGFKLRCGGLHASSFPMSELIAYTIRMCCRVGAPLKFTAGLHHPIRHFDCTLQTHVHGFINLFAAGVLGHARRLNEEQLRAIIEDEDPKDFVFEDEGFRWKDWHATTEEIVAARCNVVSFGSCSFDEPRKDLRKLGWL